MRVLVKDRADLIEALVAEVNVGRVTTALLEKDEHPAQLVQQPRQIVVASEAGEVLRMGV